MLHIKTATHISGHRLWVCFDDGTAGEVDLSNVLIGDIFKPLLDETYFAQVKVDPELETVVWPNGADLAPEFLKRYLQAGHERVSW